MGDDSNHTKPPGTREMTMRPCPTCDQMMRFTGLPDVSGPIYYRIYKCPKCGFVRHDVDEEDPVGWG